MLDCLLPLLAQAKPGPGAPLDTSKAVEMWTFIFVAITFMIYLYIGWRARVRESAGFYVAGQGVPAIANGAATAADWMSAASFISMAGLISFMGSDGSVYLMGWTGGYVLLALLLAPYLRKFGKFTVPDFVGERYYSDTARVVAAICAIFVSFTYVAGQMRGVGIVFSRFLEVEIWFGVVVGMIIVAFFAVLGGMKGITWTQVVQYFVLIFAFLVPSIAIAKMLTGNPFPQGAFTLSDISTKLNAIQNDLGFGNYTDPFVRLDKLNVFCLATALMLGTAGLPHVIVRFYTVKNVRAARYSAFWALLFIAILYTTAPALAMFARTNLLTTLSEASIERVQVKDETPGLSEDDAIANYDAAAMGDQAFAMLLDGVRTHNAAVAEQQERIEAGQNIPADQLLYPKQTSYHLSDTQGQAIGWADSWQKTGLIKFDDKDNNRSLSLHSVEGKFAEANIDRDIIVLSTPEVARLAPWVIALVAAGGLAAALSTAAGLLLVISSSIAHDLYIHYVDPNASEAKRLLVGRLMIFGAIIIAGYFGVNPPGFVGEVVAFAFGLAAASFFPAILLGIFDSRTNRQGAIAGMIVGIGFTGIYILGNTAHKILPGVSEPWFGTWCFGISPQGIGTVGCVLNFAVTLLISRITPAPPQEVMDLVQSVRVPTAARPPEAHFDEEDAEANGVGL